jgi:hypothetical protein
MNSKELGMQRFFAIVLILMLTFSLVACGGGSSALLGKWSLEPGQPTSGNIEDMELLKDGSGIVDGAGITWKVENSRFYVTHPLMAASWGYKISGATLVLTNDEGESLTYKKK